MRSVVLFRQKWLIHFGEDIRYGDSSEMNTDIIYRYMNNRWVIWRGRMGHENSVRTRNGRKVFLYNFFLFFYERKVID